MKGVTPRRSRFSSGHLPSAKRYFPSIPQISPNRSAILQSFTIHGGITNELQNFIAIRFTHGKQRWLSHQKNTKLWPRITPTFFVRSVKRVKPLPWKAGRAKNVAVNCGCTGCADKSAFLPDFRAHVAELADAYGSGPYGATRGGSSPLVSNFLASSCPFAEYLSTLKIARISLE